MSERVIHKIGWEDGKVVVPSLGISCGPIYLNNVENVCGLISSRLDARSAGQFRGSLKQKSQALNDYLGVTPTKWRKAWNGIVYENYVKPLQQPFGDNPGNIWDDHIFTRWKTNELGNKQRRIERAYSMLDVLGECYSNGSRNVTPFIMNTGLLPQELRKMFGKGRWKAICKNSLHRNKLICKNLWSPYHPGIDRVANFDNLRNVPSTCLAHSVGMKTDSIKWAWPHLDKYSDKRELARLCSTYIDTQRMCTRSDIEFNPKWSVSRMEEVHTHCIQEMNQRRDFFRVGVKPSEDTIEWLQRFDKETKYEGFTATLLDTTQQIFDEGRAMHHCVGSYAASVYKGNYLVYSITDSGGERYSTLGVRTALASPVVNTGAKFRLDQHYMACNKYVEDVSAKALAEKVVLELNKKEMIT